MQVLQQELRNPAVITGHEGFLTSGRVEESRLAGLLALPISAVKMLITAFVDQAIFSLRFIITLELIPLKHSLRILMAGQHQLLIMENQFQNLFHKQGLVPFSCPVYKLEQTGFNSLMY
jgi:hypothetical protein